MSAFQWVSASAHASEPKLDANADITFAIRTKKFSSASTNRYNLH